MIIEAELGETLADGVIMLRGALNPPTRVDGGERLSLDLTGIWALAATISSL